MKLIEWNWNEMMRTTTASIRQPANDKLFILIYLLNIELDLISLRFV